jgi:hypothetical protein
MNFAVPGTSEIVFRITTPNVRISSIALDPSGFVTLTWPAATGKSYQVVYKTNVTDSAWTILTPDLPAAGTTTFKSDPFAGNRFYSVRELP